MEVWEQGVLGIGAVAMLFFFFPGASRALKETPEASSKDWMGALLPIAAVVGFVVLLVMMV